MSKKNIAVTAGMISLLTMISKCIGFVREMVMAGCYGTSRISDIYVLSNTIPTGVLESLFLAVATAYMPLLAENDRKGNADRFTRQVITIMNMIAAVSVLLGCLCSGWLVRMFGYSGDAARIAEFFCRVSFCFVMFSSVIQIQTSYLQYKGVFLPQIIAGYTMSMSIIVFIILSKKVGIYLLPFGYLVGYFLQMVLQRQFMKRVGYRHRIDVHFSQTARDIARFAPMVFVGGMVSYINQFIDKMFATSLSEGSVSSLNYAVLVQAMIISVTGTVITTLIYPELTRAAAGGELKAFENMLKRGISLIIIITVPFAFGIMAFHNEVVQVIFERGAFGSASTDMTSSAFLCYGIGIVFSALNALIVQAYYSLKDMKTSVWCGMLGVAVNISMDWLLIKLMGNAGLALASSLAALVNTVTLILLFRKKYAGIRMFESAKKVAAVTAAAGIAVISARIVYSALAYAVWMPRLCYLLLAVASAGIIYCALLWKMGIEEAEMVKKMFRR